MSNESESWSSGIEPRQEAKPFSWDALTEDQSKTVEDIHDWLVAYIAHTPESYKPRETFLGWNIDIDRPSNVLLIDGGRGSGKTSVMLSMLHLWTQLLGDNADEQLQGWQPLRENLEKLKGRLVPVRVLDIQPLPPATSLRTWIAGRLLTLAEDFTARAEDTMGREANAQRSLLFSDKEEPGWKKAWRALLQDAAAGWQQEGGPSRDKLDPETFAVELEQAELARLGITDRWRNFVDQIVLSLSTSGKNIDANARIIISIDDADMNPARCVELLELLRNLWHPRVVFLLTGHSELFMKILTLHFLGVFRAQLGQHNLSDFERMVIENREPTADELAYQSYDKVLPPRQRFALNTLAPRERIHLLGDVLSVRIQKKEATADPKTLREYFDLNSHAIPALPPRLRRIQSLKQALTRHRHGEPFAAVLVHVVWLDSFSDEVYRLPAAYARQVREMVGVENGRIRLRDISRRFQIHTSRTKHFQFPGNLHLLKVSELEDFAYPLNSGDRDVFLPPRLTAALLLAVDLFLEEATESFDSLSPLSAGFDHELIRNELHLPAGPDEILASPTQKPVATWPLPDWRMPLDFAVFSDHWNEALKSSSGPPQQHIGFIACAFLWSVIAAHKRDLNMKPILNEGQPDWTELTDRLVGLSQSLSTQVYRTERDNRFLDWLLGRAILLAAPESGLPPEVANSLLSSWLVHLNLADIQLRERAFEAARTERQGQAIRINRHPGNVSDFIVNLDSKFPHHQWAKKIEMQGKGSLSPLQDSIRVVLSNFPIRQKNSNLSEPGDLAQYMQQLQLRILVTPYFAKQAREALDRLKQTGQGASAALLYLWKNLVNEFQPENPQLRTLLNRAFSADKPKFELPGSLRSRLASYEREQIGVKQTIHMHEGETKLRLYDLAPPKPLDALSQFLILVHDVLWDTNNYAPDWIQEPRSSANQFIALPHAETIISFKGASVRIGWPAPRWATFLDFKLEDRHMSKVLAPLEVESEDSGALEYPRQALSASLYAALSVSAGIGEIRNANPSLQFFDQDFAAWHRMGDRLRHLFDSESEGNRPLEHRRQLLVNWAHRAVPLYATPEMGLPANFAKALLAGWAGAPQNFSEEKPLSISRRIVFVHGIRQVNYRQLRLNWLTKCLQNSGIPATDSEATQLIQELELQHPKHPWNQVFGSEILTNPTEDA